MSNLGYRSEPRQSVTVPVTDSGYHPHVIIRVLWTTRECAPAIAALPVGGPLPSRTVLLPRERVAHSVRQEMLLEYTRLKMQRVDMLFDQ